MPAGDAPPSPPGTPLSEAARRRGRWLAWLSHPAGMTHRFAYTSDLPTLALVSLGASEIVIGLQRALEHLGQLLQLPTLRAVGRVRKRSILVAGQLVAILAGLPLVLWYGFASRGPGAVPFALACFAGVSVGIVISGTVWFPLLRSYVEPERIGSFFGILRTGWHVTLIVYFLAAQRWLAAHPEGFGLLFAVASVLGILRIALVARLPEAEGERGTPIRVREALALVRGEPALRRYLAGMSLFGGARQAVIPFVIVWMRREMGLSAADVLLATVASFAGGLVSLYLWGRLVDRSGPGPVFRGTAVATALMMMALHWIPATPVVWPMVALFFAFAVLFAGFGVADTHLLFSITPTQAPSRHLVVASVTTSTLSGLVPLAAGLALEQLLAVGVPTLSAYRGLFGTAAVLALLALIPLRHFR
ncbi:MAG: MFS transporter [Myxococcota bacterium]